MRRGLLGLLLLLGLLIGCSASAPDPSIPHITDGDRGWVDTSGTVSGETMEALRDQSDRVGQAGFQLAGVFFRDIASDPAQFATKVANENGIGSAEKDNGLTIMVLLDRPGNDAPKPYIFVATGRGLEGLLPDSKVTLFRENFFNPLRKDGAWQEGLVLLATKFADFLSDPQADEFRDLSLADESGLPLWLWIIIVIVLLVVIVGGALGGANYGYGGSYYSSSSSSSNSGSSGGSFGGGGSSGGGGSGG